MSAGHNISNGSIINSRLSLKPLADMLQQMIAEDKPGAKKLYEPLIIALEKHPSLLSGVEDVSILRKETEIIEMLMATLFPPYSFESESLYAIVYPFTLETIYASSAFEKLFMEPETEKISIPDVSTRTDIEQASFHLAYNLILHKCLSFNSSLTSSSIHQVKDAVTGLTRYFELKMDGRYVNVECTKKDFVIPEQITSFHALTAEEKKQLLPLEYFFFEGIIIIDVEDVTAREVISEIKNTLLAVNSFSDASIYDNLQAHIQTLMEIIDIKIGITPFFKMNNYYLFSELHLNNSLIFKNNRALKEKNWLNEYCQEMFKDNNQPVYFEELTEKNASDEFLDFFYEQNIRSLIICPLKSENELIGLLEIGAKHKDILKPVHISKIESAIPLFTLALSKSMENLEMQIDRRIKESFTAVQSAVEWKFTEAAFQYIQQKQVNENAKMPPIIFEDVYPLYGAIDIRSSSEERSKAIQLDLVEQLKLAQTVVEKTKNSIQFPLLKEVEFKIDKYLQLNPEHQITEDEMVIQQFLQEEVYSIFSNSGKNMPELMPDINVYMNALDPQRKIIYHHRKDYEESITRINDTLEKFIEHEQLTAQQVFPHYFEHYVTDGVEFNIYIGQSIAPNLKFDEIYVRNLKMWQLTVLAKAGRLAHALEKKVTLPLQTTQLILSHTTPISISFRSKERKFDVDGAYNIRYEIVKKRIDKVHIKDKKERLTKPGTIAIVYGQQKEKMEYLEFIEVLQKDGLLLLDTEELELEELQGVSGLNALRVGINLSNHVNKKGSESNDQ